MSTILEDTIDRAAAPDFVEAEVRYVLDDGAPPYRYIDWPEMQGRDRPPAYEPRRVRIVNGRTCGETFALATHGFALVERPTKMRDFYDEDEVVGVYYPETEALIREASGARRVIVFDHTVRTADRSRLAERWVRETVHAVHNDYTERSAPQRVRDFLPPDEAEEALKGRYGIVQTWRSVAPRVESEPLAMCDGKSIPEVGFIPYERRYRDRTAETYHLSYSARHRFFYFPQMTRDEAMVFKVFDTDPSAGVRFTAHTAFHDPTTPPDAKGRESIEMRALAFY